MTIGLIKRPPTIDPSSAIASGFNHDGRFERCEPQYHRPHVPLAHISGDAYIAARLGADYGGRLRTRMNMLANQSGKKTRCERPVKEPVARPLTACAGSD